MHTTRRPGRRPVRRLLWLGLPVAVLVFVSASAPAIAQRIPRFAFPTVAALGAGLAVFSFVSALVRFARRAPGEGRPPLLAVVANAVAMLFLVVFPLTRALGVVFEVGRGAPRVLAGFGAWLGGEGYPRLSPHRGVDFAGRLGVDVLAAADGRVTVARDSRGLCGLIIVIVHDPHGYRTVYCHSAALAVAPGDVVARGQRIGTLGTTGQRAWPGFEHVHLELQRGTNSQDVEDPAPRIVGCFDGQAPYPVDRLVLTYPVRC
jgi:murein DD-endopeptidase MepM/ murein hydrolase activator NlpD